MKLVANIRLKPTPEQEKALRATLERCNEACNWLSERGFAASVLRQYDMQKAFYGELRATFGLTAQVAIQSIKKVADAYKTAKANLQKGKELRQVEFRKHAAQPYDDRILRFCGDDLVSLWLLHGREKIAFVCGEHQRKLLEHRKGEVDLMFVRGKWYLCAVCDFDDPGLLAPDGMLGVDMGIVNIATDSEGNKYSGAAVEKYRERYAKRRAILQRVGTKAAKKRLRKMSGRQARYQKHQNHCISKSIVATAERHGMGIALEDLTHIRSRVRANKEQRKRLHNWAFGQLRAFVEYKAKRVGISCVTVDPRNTSRTCPACGHVAKGNRKTQSEFRCLACGHEANADENAAGNISRRATVTKPMFAHTCAPYVVESPRL